MFRRALLTAIAVAAITICIALAADASPPPGRGVSRVSVPDSPEYSLVGLNEKVIPAYAYVDGLHQARVRAELERIVREHQAAAARLVARGTSKTRGSSTASITGSCAEMAPAGWMSANIDGFTGAEVIARESGGNAGAVNGGSGAAGCVQIIPEHYSPNPWGNGPGRCHENHPLNGGVRLSYPDCWNALWSGGAGWRHWACTPASGCRR